MGLLDFARLDRDTNLYVEKRPKIMEALEKAKLENNTDKITSYTESINRMDAYMYNSIVDFYEIPGIDKLSFYEKLHDIRVEDSKTMIDNILNSDTPDYKNALVQFYNMIPQFNDPAYNDYMYNIQVFVDSMTKNENLEKINQELKNNLRSTIDFTKYSLTETDKALKTCQNKLTTALLTNIELKNRYSELKNKYSELEKDFKTNVYIFYGISALALTLTILLAIMSFDPNVFGLQISPSNSLKQQNLKQRDVNTKSQIPDTLKAFLMAYYRNNISGCFIITNKGASRLEGCSDWYGKEENRDKCSCGIINKTSNVKCDKADECLKPYCIGNSSCSNPDNPPKCLSDKGYTLYNCTGTSIDDPDYVSYMYIDNSILSLYSNLTTTLELFNDKTDDKNKKSNILLYVIIFIVVVFIISLIIFFLKSKKFKKLRSK